MDFFEFPVWAFSVAAVGALAYVRSSKTSSSRPSSLRIGTRSSALAMVQTMWVKEQLLSVANTKAIVQTKLASRGDKVLDKSLKELSTKTPGLFTKELEDGLLSHEYDVCVHSLKDMPTTLPAGLVLASICRREDPRDVVVVAEEHRGRGGLSYLDGLGTGAVVGTSSVRREATIRGKYPNLTIKLIRGNVGTRLGKLDSGEYDAVVLARAGLDRLNLSSRIETVLDPSGGVSLRRLARVARPPMPFGRWRDD